MDIRSFRQTARAWIDAHAEEMIADLQAFTRIRSVSRADLAAPGAPFGPECRQMLDFALDHARKMGFETEDHEGYCGSAIYGDKNNALGIIAHIDVVDVYKRQGLAGNGEALLHAHLVGDAPFQLVHLFAVAVEKLHETLLRAGRAAVAQQLEGGKGEVHFIQIHQQILHPQGGALAHGGNCLLYTSRCV